MDLHSRDLYIYMYSSDTYDFARDRPMLDMYTALCDPSEIKVEGKHHQKGLKEA